jgi:hypothetical protein
MRRILSQNEALIHHLKLHLICGHLQHRYAKNRSSGFC